jgi:hypothetical protein
MALIDWLQFLTVSIATRDLPRWREIAKLINRNTLTTKGGGDTQRSEGFGGRASTLQLGMSE